MEVLSDVLAPAKLNLFLHVVGRRADGYHLLQSVFVPIDWCDRLSFKVRVDGRLIRHDLTQPLPADDLCLRAARLLQTETGCTQGADVLIEKHIPSGAGMGGGSSDAATTLMALNRLWALSLPSTELMRLGLKLGADVPFFIAKSAAWVEGVGEKITPITVPSMRFLVVKPAVDIPTASIFTHPSLVRNTPALQAPQASAFRFDCPHSVSPQSAYHNDLETVAKQVSPEVQEALTQMERLLGSARMTGSGSAVFGLLQTPEQELTANAWLKHLPAGWCGRICKTVVGVYA